MNMAYPFRLFLFLILTTSLQVYSQQKNITLEEIWQGAFQTQSLERLHSLENGKQYSVLQYNRSTKSYSIDVYDYQTSQKQHTVIDTKNTSDINQILRYNFSPDETKVLIATQLQQIYRRSALGIYWVYDTRTKQTTLIAENGIQEPTFSPDGNRVAYGYENNLYIKDLTTGKTTQITTDGVRNQIINGITDWVYEEEFAFVRAFDWNQAGDKIAYIRFDESRVPEFSMDIYGNGLYPFPYVFKYPKAGEENSQVSLHLYDLKTAQTREIDLSAYQNYYIPRILWTQDDQVLSIRTTNRRQNEVDLLFYDANTHTSRLILKETDPAYVDITDDLTFLADNSFIWSSEKDGWNHLYHYDKNGKLLHQLTQGPWEVTAYYGYDANNKKIFYQSTENGAINRDVYSVGLNGKNKTRLTAGAGRNSASFSADFSVFINTFSNTTTPPNYTLLNAANGKIIREILNNQELAEKLNGYQMSDKEFSTIQINGYELNMYQIKPKDFDPTKKYPVFMYQYSGPGSQQVSNSWHSANDYWHQMLAQEGYIIVCVDGRGTGYKGRDFKKLTQKELGKYEVEDQIAVAEKLKELPYVDSQRIGIWGWSYGGFMSSNCLFQAPDTFSLAIAVAPVSSWRFYDTIYTERYMLTPQENPRGYDDNSPISHVDNLQGKFLLVHGSADDNVHVQNTMVLAEKLIQANKPFEWLIYPDKNHGIGGGNTRLHLYTKMTNFILENL